MFSVVGSLQRDRAGTSLSDWTHRRKQLSTAEVSARVVMEHLGTLCMYIVYRGCIQKKWSEVKLDASCARAKSRDGGIHIGFSQ